MHPSVQAEKKPDHIAMIMARSGETVTYGELEARSNQGAQLFRALGLKRGDGIAMFMENNRHFMEIYWAAQRSGLYLTPISSRLTAGEVAYIVRDCGAKVFISSTEKGDVAEKVVADLPDVAACYSVNGTVPGFRSYEEAIAAQPAERIADESGGDVMLYSSGTTGRPKGVRRN
ncbi:MAG TPA: acyl-CoA synthetase, partial [Alphaproteobacteria bacterium]|nr:acyl-CoA synthetase [Alphaproteobacteria bacterium]